MLSTQNPQNKSKKFVVSDLSVVLDIRKGKWKINVVANNLTTGLMYKAVGRYVSICSYLENIVCASFRRRHEDMFKKLNLGMNKTLDKRDGGKF